MAKAPDNPCLTVPLPPTSLTDLLKHQTLFDMIPPVTPVGCPRKATFSFSKALGKSPPPLKILPTSWKPADAIQSQSRLHRADTHAVPMMTFDLAGPWGSVDLKIIEDTRRRYDEMINRTMIGYPHRSERRPFPDPTDGLEDAIRLDCCESACWRIGFGTVVLNQEDFDQDTIERWIWGPNGEFTGYPAGDPAFEDTWKEVRRSDQPEVTRLLEFAKVDIQFRFTPRYTVRQMRDPLNYRAFDAYHQGHARSQWPYMVQFATYHDQAEWVRLARYAAQEESKSPMRLNRGF